MVAGDQHVYLDTVLGVGYKHKLAIESTCWEGRGTTEGNSANLSIGITHTISDRRHGGRE